MALNSDSLGGQVRKERKGKKSKKKEVLGSVKFGSADDFVDPKRSSTSASVQAVGSGPTVLASVPAGPGRIEVPVKFGQSNPFALSKKVVSASEVGAGGSNSPGTVERGDGYIGFVLTSALPPGIPWGDTPYPGSLAAARLRFAVDLTSTTETKETSVVPPSPAVPTDLVLVDATELNPYRTSNPAPVIPSIVDAPEQSLIIGTPQTVQGSLFMYSREGGQLPSTVDLSTAPEEDAMDEGIKLGHKRKPERVRDRTKKVSKNKMVGAVNTLLLDNSSSGSDRTVIGSDTPTEATAAEDSNDLEVPPTPDLPLSVTCGPDIIVPGDRFSAARYSYENTGICPWIHKLTHAYFQAYRQPPDSLANINEFLKVISEVFADITSRLDQFESIKGRLEKLEEAQAKPSYSQVVGAPLFFCGGPRFKCLPY
ncbi:hypothetical protein AVEN_202392-1 [Araneus ventricosus]|uniref:Uncharacterized protein n=1 Tax=Araneus ventricosus TaxID=182803 RepID=A0A4Y2IY15_ARAVE|nr:hypothetical protein AVEN_202392-1 [Araneus ventricosus]